jgi:WD40 repeat protein
VHATPDSAYLAVDDECGRTTMYDLLTGTVTALFTVPSTSINDASGLAGDRFAFGDSHGDTYVYDVHGHELFALVDGAGAVEGINSSEDGRMIATASSDGILRIWNGLTGLLMRRIDTGEILNSVAVAPDGSAVYTDTHEGLIEGFDACPLCGDGHALLAASNPLAVRNLSPEERRAFGAAG